MFVPVIFLRDRSSRYCYQEPEGPTAPKTPDRWVPMWETDSARLEEAHHKGDVEVVVFGRKYVVDVKVRPYLGRPGRDERRAHCVQA